MLQIKKVSNQFTDETYNNSYYCWIKDMARLKISKLGHKIYVKKYIFVIAV